MLKVYFNKVSFEIDGCIGNTSKYFDAEYEPSWFSSEEAKHIIRDIDNSEYISGEYIESPVLGGISPMMLSTGCKTLLLLLNEPELIVSGDRMGDNCFPWLLRIAQERDVTITLSHSVELKEPFEMYSIESNKMVKTNLEILEELYSQQSKELEYERRLGKVLRLSFKYNEQAINNVDGYFNNNYEDEWFNDPMVKEMVKDVDNTEVVSPNLMLSPVLGPIPPKELSNEVKALILMLKVPEVWVWGTACGDNCSKWIIQIGKMQDINVSLTHLMMFEEDFDAVCVDTGESIHCLNDYWRCVGNGLAAR